AGITEMQRLLDDPAALKPLPAVELSDVAAPEPQAPPLPPLESRVPQATDHRPEREGNGRSPVEVGAPFGPSAQLAALQEPPAPVEMGPPTQPVPFAVTGDGSGPWLPSELRAPADEPL